MGYVRVGVVSILILILMVISMCESVTIIGHSFFSEAGVTLNSSKTSYAGALFTTNTSSSADLSFATFFTFSRYSPYTDNVLTDSVLAFVITPGREAAAFATLPAHYPSLGLDPQSSADNASADNAYALIINFTHTPAVNDSPVSISIDGRHTFPIGYLSVAVSAGPSYEFHASVEYKAAIHQSVITLIPGIAGGSYNYTEDLSAVLNASTSTVGFVSTGGGVFTISDWNLTSHGSFYQIWPGNDSNAAAATITNIVVSMTLSLVASLMLF